MFRSSVRCTARYRRALQCPAAVFDNLCTTAVLTYQGADTKVPVHASVALCARTVQCACIGYLCSLVSQSWGVCTLAGLWHVAAGVHVQHCCAYRSIAVPAAWCCKCFAYRLLGSVQDCLQCGSVNPRLEPWTILCFVSLVPNTQPVLFTERIMVCYCVACC
jgi:hypothetical protein